MRGWPKFIGKPDLTALFSVCVLHLRQTTLSLSRDLSKARQRLATIVPCIDLHANGNAFFQGDSGEKARLFSEHLVLDPHLIPWEGNNVTIRTEAQ